MDPTGSDANPIGEDGVIAKFRGINPRLPAQEIADVALHIERHTVRDLLGLLVPAKQKGVPDEASQMRRPR
jgi:hypothetical protein